MFTGCLRPAAAVALTCLTLTAAPACTAAPTQAPHAPPSAIRLRAGPVTSISAGCAGSSAEVEEAAAPPGYVYAEWIGCGGIGFARSTDSGRRFGTAMTVPGSKGASWDPAITVAADGIVYAAFMHASGGASGTFMYPVVAVSRDHGATFTQVHKDQPAVPGNWGDRVFIAAGPRNQLFLTWDYGPSSALVRTRCVKGGSCSFTRGDFNAVIQASGNGGATWGPITHLQPGFPLGGGYGAPLVVLSDGRIAVLYQAHPTDPGTGTVHPGYEYFTSSQDPARWPATPRKLWPGQGTLSVAEWWIDGDISADAAGNLYVTWDTQTAASDTGWLTYSQDGGRSWSAPLRVTPDNGRGPRIVESAGGQAGIAYIAWQGSMPGLGYATYLRPFSIKRGWLAPAIKVSAAYGNVRIWPGDTFGIASLPGGRISLTWGSAAGESRRSEIYASIITI